MAKLFYYSNDNSPQVNKIAPHLGFRPTLWIKPQGEKYNALTGWIFGQDNPHHPPGIVHVPNLRDACQWRIDAQLKAGHYPDRLIPNHELYRWYIEPGDWPLTPAQTFEQHKITIDTVKSVLPCVKVGLWGIPLIHRGLNASHEGLQYVGALAAMCDITCPSAYAKGDEDGPFSNEMDRLKVTFDHATVWQKPMHAYLNPFYQMSGRRFFPLTRQQFRQYCEFVKVYEPEAVEMWSMATRDSDWDHTLPPDCNVPNVEIMALEVVSEVFA
jgi:hypothetical protein